MDSDRGTEHDDESGAIGVDYTYTHNTTPSTHHTKEDILETGLLQHVMDVASRCVGILFDLFPDAITNVMLSKQTVSQIHTAIAVSLSTLSGR